MESLIWFYYSIDFSYIFMLLSIFVFHKMKFDKYLHHKIIASVKMLLIIKIIGKITWGVGVSIIGGIILPIMSFTVIYEAGFWLGVLFIAIGVLMEEKSRKYIELMKG